VKSLFVAELDSSEDTIAAQVGPKIPQLRNDVANAHEAILADGQA
jgi:hypothetical protein